MPAPNLTPEDEAWMRKPGRKLGEVVLRFPEMFAAPMSGGHAMLILDKLDDIATQLRARDAETAEVMKLLTRYLADGGAR